MVWLGMLDPSIENPNTATAWYISSSQIHLIYISNTCDLHNITLQNPIEHSNSTQIWENMDVVRIFRFWACKEKWFCYFSFRNNKNQRKKVIFETSKIWGFYSVSLATPSMTNSNNHKVKTKSTLSIFWANSHLLSIYCPTWISFIWFPWHHAQLIWLRCPQCTIEVFLSNYQVENTAVAFGLQTSIK